MKLYRLCITLVIIICSNVLFGQRKETVSVSLDEIKDMPQKIITAYFKPVYSSTGVHYPLMQWYAYENKVDTWDQDALNKFNATIYSFKDEPIKAAKFALQFCRSFGEKDFTENFKAIGFNSVEINCILRCYGEAERWKEIALIKDWQNNGIPRFDNNETSVSAKYKINIDGEKMRKYLSDNVRRNKFDDYTQIEINPDGTYSLKRPQYEFIQICDIVPAKKIFTYADTTISVPVFSKIKISETFVDDIEYKIKLGYNKKESKWVFKKGTFRDDYFWEKIKEDTPYFDYINVLVEKLQGIEMMDNTGQYELDFSIGASVIEVEQADKDARYIQQAVKYYNDEVPYLKYSTLHKKK